jgi:protein SCO1/2
MIAHRSNAGSHVGVPRRRAETRRWLAIGVLLTITLLASTARAGSVEDYRLRAFKVGSDFVLTNQDGGRTRLRDFKGKVVLLFFGFTNCPDVCPTTLFEMGNVLKSLQARADALRVVFVSIDPERDTPEHLKKYVSSFHDDIIGLTGSEEELIKVAKVFDTRFAKQPHQSGETYAVDHSSFVFLLDQDGAVRYVFPHDIGSEVLVDGVNALVTSKQ